MSDIITKCPNCNFKHVYNKGTQKIEGICDKCGYPIVLFMNNTNLGFYIVALESGEEIAFAEDLLESCEDE